MTALLEIAEKRGGGEGKNCQGCGKGEGEDGGMVRCKGCESVWYCGKASFHSLLGMKKTSRVLLDFDFEANYFPGMSNSWVD